MAQIRNGVMQLPSPFEQYCDSQGWTLFRFIVTDRHHVKIEPVLPGDSSPFHASLAPDGKLWIPAEMRDQVSLGEQSVMLRIAEGGINMYIRKVFETLGFRPD